MEPIFISYRRSQCAKEALEIYRQLAAKFDERRIFLDQMKIPPGRNFKDWISHRIQECKCFIVVIGPDWEFATDTKGGYRLSQKSDHVRFEIETALRYRKFVLPILIGRDDMPKREDLPQSLAELVDINALHLDSELHISEDKLNFIARITRIDLWSPAPAPRAVKNSEVRGEVQFSTVSHTQYTKVPRTSRSQREFLQLLDGGAHWLIVLGFVIAALTMLGASVYIWFQDQENRFGGILFGGSMASGMAAFLFRSKKR